MTRAHVRAVLITAFVLLLCSTTGGSAALAQSSNPGTGIRNTRYCEVLLVSRVNGQSIASVYNTLGQNDCPPDQWNALSTDQIQAQTGALAVILNGPRYWVMDQIVASGATATGETVRLGGLGLTKRAEVAVDLSQPTSMPYVARDIQRDTEYDYKAGELVYELISPDGYVYVMQTYSQQVDPTLTIDQLPALDTRLKLPHGWSFAAVTLSRPLALSAYGAAHLVQDDFQNSYQRVEPSDFIQFEQSPAP